jgi:hypothetical protein
MNRLKRLLTPFGLASLACLMLAGWALWTGGILDGPIARVVRTSSVYAAPGVGLDRAAAERVIGNRRLVVILLPTDSDRRAACHDVRRAAEGTLVVVLSRSKNAGGSDDDGFDSYGCATFDDDAFGKSFVSEQLIAQGIDGFADRPLDAVKVIAVNYDLLVRAQSVPDGARVISPSLPRYLVAIAAIAAVLLGSGFVYFAGRRAGRLTAARGAARAGATDERSLLSAGVGVLAQQIVDLDDKPRTAAAERKYRRLASDYAGLVGDPDLSIKQVTALQERARKLG